MKEAKDYKESAQKHIQEAKAEWSTFGKTGVFILAVLGVIAVLCLAWFVSNTSVTSLVGGISASDNGQYLLACTGERLQTESEHLLNQVNEDPLTWGEARLPMGDLKSYDQYIDMTSGESVEITQDYYTKRGEFAWCLQDPVRFYPGARGELELYLIPQVDGLTTVQLQLEVVPYRKVEDGNKKTGAVPLENETLANLVKGHVLLFAALDDNAGYSGWIGEDHTITVGKEETELIKDMPYKVTIYWIWPKQYRNLIYDKYTTRGDLFSNTENNTDYTGLMHYINNNKNYFFYPEGSFTDETSNQMSQDAFDQGVLAYNQADEYIGTNVDYLYISVNTEL